MTRRATSQRTCVRKQAFCPRHVPEAGPQARRPSPMGDPSSGPGQPNKNAAKGDQSHARNDEGKASGRPVLVEQD